MLLWLSYWLFPSYVDIWFSCHSPHSFTFFIFASSLLLLSSSLPGLCQGCTDRSGYLDFSLAVSAVVIFLLCICSYYVCELEIYSACNFTYLFNYFSSPQVTCLFIYLFFKMSLWIQSSPIQKFGPRERPVPSRGTTLEFCLFKECSLKSQMVCHWFPSTFPASILPIIVYHIGYR